MSARVLALAAAVVTAAGLSEQAAAVIRALQHATRTLQGA